MKRYVMSALALAALTGTAFAQQPPAPPAPAGAPPAADAVMPPPPPGGPADPQDRAAPPPPPPRGPEGAMGPRGHRPPPPPPPSKAAHFRVEDGETKIDIKCADDEPMKACADILLQVIDRLNGPAQN
ncbi:hypothetical protein [Allorhizobium terrae]|uniref:Uncharacterized protein n=1 Tax=Allorhizobium terrae TaxID=1848972 RepID=A0A4S3ZUC2_9HYPH|nr:hypothetical protein [Allorhizobium terrae]THF49323.1 hypothetical protein E6C51_13180 [Allorhizobium terrae]